MKIRVLAAVTLALAGGCFANAQSTSPVRARFAPQAWSQSFGTDVVVTSLILVFALLDEAFDAISREITVSVDPPDGPAKDAISREITLSVGPPDGPARDAISREVTIAGDPFPPADDVVSREVAVLVAVPDGPPTDIVSREITAWNDPYAAGNDAVSREVSAWFDREKDVFYSSREISVGGTATLTGTITFGDIDPLIAPTQATVEVRDSAGNVVSSHLVTLVNGTYTISGLPRAQFSVSVKDSHWLRRSYAHYIGSSATPTLDFALINGDIDGDNIISILDYIELSTAYESSTGDPNWNPNADLDRDGTVSILDYIILSSNYDLEGDN
jgi:hypothetical protein